MEGSDQGEVSLKELKDTILLLAKQIVELKAAKLNICIQGFQPHPFKIQLFLSSSKPRVVPGQWKK